jgi:hypothetical protein
MAFGDFELIQRRRLVRMPFIELFTGATSGGAIGFKGQTTGPEFVFLDGGHFDLGGSANAWQIAAVANNGASSHRWVQTSAGQQDISLTGTSLNNNLTIGDIGFSAWIGRGVEWGFLKSATNFDQAHMTSLFTQATNYFGVFP